MIGCSLQTALNLKVSPTSLDLNKYGWKQSPLSLWWYRSTPLTDDLFADREALAVAAGGHLCQIPSAAENNWITETLDDQQGTVASTQIGYYSPIVDGNYEWIDGSADEYTNWADTYPVGAPASVANLQLASGLLLADGWKKNPDNGHWYKAITPSSITWDAANTLALSYGARLPVLTSAALNTWFKTNITAPYGNSLWIGLRYTDGTHQWVDGSTLDFTNWAVGEPDGDYGCVASPIGQWCDYTSGNVVKPALEIVDPARLTDAHWTVILGAPLGQWIDDADAGTVGVMQIKDTTSITESQLDVIKLLGFGWLYSSETGSWYRLDGSLAGWDTHSATATTIGAELAAITSDTLNTWLVDYLEDATTGAAWLGLQKDGTWDWTTGDTFTFANWDTLQPTINPGATVGLVAFETDSIRTKYKWRASGDAEGVDNWVNIADADAGTIASQGWVDTSGSFYEVIASFGTISGQAFGRADGFATAPFPYLDLSEWYGLEDATIQFRLDIEAVSDYAISNPTTGPNIQAEFRNSSDVIVSSFTSYHDVEVGDYYPGTLNVTSSVVAIPTTASRIELRIDGAWGNPFYERWHFDDLEINIKQGIPHEAIYEIKNPATITDAQWRVMTQRYGLQGL